MAKVCGNKALFLFIGISVAIFCTALFLIGCGSNDGDSDFTAEDGEYAIGNDNDTGGYFEIIGNNIYNLRLFNDKSSHRWELSDDNRCKHYSI